ncbi:MAG: hypothetical protein A2X94_13355 [Bdellovibrionales bacterium GWB1_55_8]|nr:MAG: hypothetical protein A2X94_13355 [Bdellovibrionales bacterium GWB1_55_8]
MRKKHFLRRILLLIAFCTTPVSAAELAASPTALPLSPEVDSISLDALAESWVESDLNLKEPITAETFLPSSAPQGLPLPRIGGTRFSYSNSNIWIRFQVENRNHTDTEWDLVVRPPHITFIEFYQFDAESKRRLSQSHFSLKQVTAGDNGPNFPLHLAQGKASIIILKLEAASDLGFQLVTRKANFNQVLRKRMAHGIYYGIAIAMILYNLFIWFSIRERPYIYYIFFLLSFALTVGILDGWVPLGRYLTFTALMTVFWASLFTRNLLETRTRLPLADTLFRAITVLSGTISFVILLPFYPKIAPPFEYLGDILIVLYILTALLTSAWLAKNGVRAAKFLTLAWSMMLLLIAMYFLAIYGMITPPVAAPELVQIGSALEMILLSFALADKIKTLRLENAIANEKAQKSEQLKKLVHIICHDLANPLTAILNNLALRKRKGEKGWEPIERAANHQKEILEQIRDLEAIESGKLVFNMQPVSVRDTLEEMRSSFSSQLEDKNVALYIQYEFTTENPFVLCDPVAFHHTILSNLISNAIKFSFKDSKITVLGRETDTEIELCVEDRGIGIPKHIRAVLFSTTAITSRLGTFGEKGTGFGMPLVHSVLKAMNGSIEVESRCAEEGYKCSGTKVTVRLQKVQDIALANLLTQEVI